MPRKKDRIPLAHFSGGRWSAHSMKDEDNLVWIVDSDRTGREVCRILTQYGGIKKGKANAMLIKCAPVMHAFIESLARRVFLEAYNYGRYKTCQDKALEILKDVSGEEGPQ